MKKRTLIIPLAMLSLLGCSERPDLRNKYSSREECERENPKNQTEDISDVNCEEVAFNGQRYYLGPAYPHAYYGHSGFYNGYWMGRSMSNNYSVVHDSGTHFTPSEIAAKGGITEAVASAKASSASSSGESAHVSSAGKASISRGGFGSRGGSSS